MVNDFDPRLHNSMKVLKGQEQGVPQKRERVFIVSVRNDVLDDIDMPFMLLSGYFQNQRKSLQQYKTQSVI